MAAKQKKKGKGTTVSVSPAKKKAVRGSGRRRSDSAVHQILPYVFVPGGIFLLICLLFPDLTGSVGVFLRDVTTGLLGGGAFWLCAELVLCGFFWRRDVDHGARGYKFVFALLSMLMLCVILQLGTGGGKIVYDAPVHYAAGKQLQGGGIVGGFAGSALLQLVGPAGAWIISCFAFALSALFYIGLTPRYLWVTLRYRMARGKENRAREREQIEKTRQMETEKLRRREEEIAAMRESCSAAASKPHPRGSKGRIDPNIYSDDIGQASFAEEQGTGSREQAAPIEEGTLIDQAVFEEAFEAGAAQTAQEAAAQSEPAEQIEPEPTEVPTGEIDLGAIFANPKDVEMTDKYDRKSGYHSALSPQAVDMTLQVERSALGDAAAEKDASPAKETAPAAKPKKQAPPAAKAGAQEADGYRFPPVSLLQRGTSDLNLDSSAELQENAQKLVQTLESFHVRTRIINVSRGPTITRYELVPEAGTRVRAIANLVDDIALNLAAPGVRIEAPIPGKSAVGVEVPNRVVSTVYLRDLIDSDAFRSAKSRLTSCLGRDVAGAPVYFDVAKMPHLLICGATGMGKSVCINAVLISLLYKATPQEMKLILIDPKKVELNIYNGLPHLLVPVVSDPKKAAGALHWAVTEMERRFELIEDVGMRDIGGYNEITENDPEKEHLSQTVIVIDELADLMMTAPDDVEESICRLAQKARAAGMHLIIGTQRPSTDVITGLIKANIPSRIAFKVSSQQDSRVVFDFNGAERLIGRGDMLFAPVGASKPQRVQGAFVSEKEIDAVIHFLKKNAGGASYRDEVMESIEKEAQLCGQKKRAGTQDAEDGAEEDPMLDDAISLAVESGKISTSLIQRRLSLGYGRAAKLVDRMEQMGIVSPPEGQKPRAVLISEAQWMERKLRRDPQSEGAKE